MKNNSYKQPGVIYVLKSEQLPGVYKVGFTSHGASARAEQIARNQPYTLEVVGCVKVTNMYAEKRLHKLLAEHRVDGEWYRLDERSVSDILNRRWLMSAGVVRLEDMRRDYARALATSAAPYAQRMCAIMAASEALDATSSRLKIEDVTSLERKRAWPFGAVKEAIYAARDAGEVGKISGGQKADCYRFDILPVGHKEPKDPQTLPLDKQVWDTVYALGQRLVGASEAACAIAKMVYQGSFGRADIWLSTEAVAKAMGMDTDGTLATLDELERLRVLSWEKDKRSPSYVRIGRLIWREMGVKQ